MKRYLIVIEETGSGCPGYSPDLPRCVSATGPRLEVEKKMNEAVAFHLAGLREEGQALPEAHTLRRTLTYRRRSFAFSVSVISFELHPPASLGLAKD